MARFSSLTLLCNEWKPIQFNSSSKKIMKYIHTLNTPPLVFLLLHTIDRVWCLSVALPKTKPTVEQYNASHISGWNFISLSIHSHPLHFSFFPRSSYLHLSRDWERTRSFIITLTLSSPHLHATHTHAMRVHASHSYWQQNCNPMTP